MNEKPLAVSPEMLKPLPKSLWGMTCSFCDKPQARWSLGIDGGEEHLVCSLCFLYSSDWGKEHRMELANSILDIERESKKKFVLDPAKRLLLPSDADAVLAAIALTSRMVQLHVEQKMAALKGGKV